MIHERADEELVLAVQIGDITAFETLVRRYQARLHYYVWRFVGNPESTDEVIQDVFFKLYQTIERVDVSKKVQSYIYAIARNTAISYVRQNRPQARIDESISDDDVSLIDVLLNKEREKIVQNAVCTLSMMQQKAIKLYYFEELSYNDISKVLHVPINTVRTHLSRAKKVLKQRLKEL